MKILLTGSRGMLGRNLEPRLLSRGHDVVAVTSKNLDLRDLRETSDLISQVSPDCIVHLAARVGGIGANIEGGESFFRENIDIDNSVFKAALDQGVKNLLYMGSSCMYPSNLVVPMSEAELWSGPLEKTNEPYAVAKLLGTRFVDSVAITEGLAWRTFIASNLYGPFDHFSPARAHMVASVIARMYAAMLEGAPSIEMWGDGTPRREFTYVEDLADFIAEVVVDLARFPTHMNVGVGEDFEIVTFYRAIAKTIGYRGQIVSNPQKPNGTMRKIMDSSVARNLGWAPTTDLEKGLQLTMKYFLESQQSEGVV